METNTNNTQIHQEEESMINLLELWQMVWHHKVWYIVSIALCLVVAAFYLYRTPSVYTRSAKVLIDESSQDATMRNLGVASANMMRMRGSFNSVENEMQAFASPDLMQVVVERLGLQTRYVEQQALRKVELYQAPIEMRLVGDNPKGSFAFTASMNSDGAVSLEEFKIGPDKLDTEVTGALGDTLTTPVGLIILYPTDKIEDFEHPIRVSWTNSRAMAKAYSGKINISLATKESSVIVLSMTDQYPTRAESVLSSLIDVYNEVWINNKNRSAINTTDFINERLVVIERDLSAVEETLKNYKAENNLTDIKAAGQAYMQESSIYAAKAFELNNQLSIANFIRDYLADPKNNNTLIPSNLGLTSSSVEKQISEYNALVLQRDRLIKASTESNPIIADINASIKSIRDAILRSVDNLIATLDLQISKIDSQEKQILSRISSSSDKEFKLLSIERQQQITQNLYIFLLQKREENELAALINVGNTRLLMAPNGSGAPVSPNRMMIILAALVLGFGIPFGIFFIRKMLDNTIKTKADLGRLSVPFLAEVPKMGKEDFDRSQCRIVVEAGNRDMMNEAFRVLRTNVDLMLGKKSQSKVIMFTSFLPAAGKTFSIMNVAASMALKGAKTILVDLDLRKATLSQSLNVSHSGVAAYLNGKIDDFRPCVDSLGENLSILPIGTLPPNPTELLLSDKFTQLIEELKAEYDYVFLDCPPIDIVADANIVTAIADMSIFVLRSGKLAKDSVKLIEELYASGKYNHMAILLNSVELKHKKYGYGKSGYGYGYGYGYGN